MTTERSSSAKDWNYDEFFISFFRLLSCLAISILSPGAHFLYFLFRGQYVPLTDAEREERKADDSQQTWSKEESGETEGPPIYREAGEFEQACKILEVNMGATEGEFKAAMRDKTSKYHPDKVFSLGKELREVAEKKMKEINWAWEIIKEKRGIK